jgi:hypothetical protein
MNTRRLAIVCLLFGACSRVSEDSGIVLNVDAEVSADRSAINRLNVTVDDKRQQWTLTQPLPGSLAIVTSPGKKSVLVEGLAGTVLRGRWTGAIEVSKGKVVVQDVHLAYVGSGVPDASPSTGDSAIADTSPRDVGRDTAVDGPRDGTADSARDGVMDVGPGPLDGSGEVGGTGGISGKGGTTGPVSLDGGAGGISGSGGATRGSGGIPGSGGAAGRGGIDGGIDGISARDSSDVASPADGRDSPSPNADVITPITLPFTGAFSVSSQFDVSATAAAPGPLGDALGLVHTFVVDPGAAIINYAGQAGVPGLSTLRSVLPDALESRLAGWMSSYIKSASVGGVTPYDSLSWLDGTVRALLLYWGLQSRLALPVGISGTHSPSSLTFALSSGSPISFPLDSTASVTAGIGVTALVSFPDGPGGRASVTISDHFMGLPFGRYALQALNAILLERYGDANLTAFLSDAVGCAGMASFVASQCVSIVCVGHESDILDVCEGGLGEGAKQIEDQITGLDFKAIHFQQGTATAIGAQVTRPQDATALQDGVWAVTVDFGSGEQPAHATFAATAEAGTP